MNVEKPSANPTGWKKSFLWLVLAVACFQAAYASIKFPVLGLFIFGYAYFLIRLTDQPNVRRAFYFGLAAGFLCAAPQLFFFWKIFNAAAIVLWIVFAFWIGLFTAISCGSIRRWGKAKAMWLIPFIWTGIEYFRSELYYLKFSWMNVGYAFPNFGISPFVYGIYGVGFLVFVIVTVFSHRQILKPVLIEKFAIILFLLIPLAMLLGVLAAFRHYNPNHKISIVGIQMEFPPKSMIPKMLDQALAKNTNAQIFVLSEYTLDGPPTDLLKDWCRKNSRFLVVGGEVLLGTTNYYDTAFVVGTNGEIVFQQVKCVPIQFFKDGLPAPEQKVWNSPWGKIGFCVCYDLSYTRVTDELVRQGAQLLIVPTMDVMDWGRHQHELHARVAPVRAAEYGIPIFRLASSGISQAVLYNGHVVSRTSIPGNGEIMTAQLELRLNGVLPLDRYLAPLCTGITGAVLVALLFLEWKDKRKSLFKDSAASADN